LTSVLVRSGTEVGVSSEVKVKGSGFEYTKKYIVDRYGRETFDRILSQMPAEAARAVDHSIPSSWYPVQYAGDLANGIKRVLGGSQKHPIFEISKEGAKATFSLIYKMFFRLGSPGFILDRVTSVWKNMSTAGELSVVERGDKFVVVRLKNFPYKNPDYCGERLRGWFHATLELSGCDMVKSVHTRCTSNGSDCCEWRFEWK
jgi:hypothetical protein